MPHDERGQQLRVESSSASPADLTIATGFTNNGTILLDEIDGGTSSAMLDYQRRERRNASCSH
ncbi:MAG: hypothetical protein U5O39_11785 [Gammaproteobacteria bacterium]|nr:hypothetical protein [Gammaproteobacteria bacterium]